MTTFTTDDRESAEFQVVPEVNLTMTHQEPIAFQCFKTPEHYVLEANIPEEIEYIKSLGFKRLVPLYDAPPPREWVVSAKYRDLADEEIEEVYKKVYEEGHQNQVIALARAILKKASE